MKFDLSQFAELDRTELLEITGGYYSTTGASHPTSIYIKDSYVIANAQNYTPSPGSSYGYTSGSNNPTTPDPLPPKSVVPAGYDPKTGWGDTSTDSDNSVLVGRKVTTYDGSSIEAKDAMEEKVLTALGANGNPPASPIRI